MADNNKKITYTVEVNDKGKVKVEGLTRGFVRLDNAVRKVNTDLAKQAAAFNSTASAGNNMINKTGLAGATLVELGRTISDSNYGIRGMANNISQLSTLFITLTVTSGGLAKGLKELWKALYGPLGLILVFQTVVTVIEGFTIKQDKAAAAARRATKALKEQASAVEDLESKISALEQSLSIVETFGDGYLSLGETVDILKRKFKDFENGYNRLSKEQQKDPKTVGKLIEAYKQYSLVREKLSEKEKEALAVQRRIAKEGEKITKGGLTIENPALLTLSGINREIAELYKKETRLFQLFKKIPKGGSEFIREQIEALQPFFEKFFFDINAKGKQVFQSSIEDVEFFGRILNENADAATKELAEKGRLREEQRKREEDSLKAGLKAIKEEAQEISLIFRATQTSLGYVNDVVMSYHDARMQALARERDYILNSGRLTEGQQRVAIREIEKREIAAQKRKIKSERDMFTQKQSLLIAEEIMKAKADMAAQARKMNILLTDIGTAAAVQAGKAKMSIGQFAAEGGLKGIAAYAISIAGMLASIFAARKKASAAIANLGGVSASSSGGDSGGTSFIAPDFNIVGTSETSQLSQTIADSEKSPLKAYVVTDDINNAQEFDRKVNAQASLG